MPGANHGQLQYEEIAGRQMANVDDRRGCGIIFQRRQPHLVPTGGAVSCHFWKGSAALSRAI
jgi:hypothetical protein